MRKKRQQPARLKQELFFLRRFSDSLCKGLLTRSKNCVWRNRVAVVVNPFGADVADHVFEFSLSLLVIVDVLMPQSLPIPDQICSAEQEEASTRIVPLPYPCLHRQPGMDQQLQLSLNSLEGFRIPLQRPRPR